MIYESLTGNTRRAAELIGEELARVGVATRVYSAVDIDLKALAGADLVLVGSWTDGLFFFGQRPGRSSRIRAIPPIYGKRCVVFCTYAIDPGKTLKKLTEILEGLGAEVLGGMAIKRTDLEGGARELVSRLRENAAV